MAIGGAAVALVLASALAAGTVRAEGPSATPTAGAGASGKPTWAQTFLQRLAQNLGVSQDRLDGALKTSADQTIDDAVQAGKLTQQQADRLKQRIDSGHGLGVLDRLLDIRERRLRRAALGKEIAAALGITPQQLHSELASGKPLSQVISAH
ncbi:MAG: hypothetical protein IRY97_05325, partial [Thermomicrobiaceae bacterium]|nr:hypothetical protein [Thermomicrobiaceae bacterium]